jgi:hypothetical protein
MWVAKAAAGGPAGLADEIESLTTYQSACALLFAASMDE